MTEPRSTRPHRRRNPLTGEWVLVSAHRTDRPWLGERVSVSADTVPPYDPACYLCPGNVRAKGARNPAYEGTYVFPNDFPALLPFDCASHSAIASAQDDVLESQPVSGRCRVICFSPRHDLHVAQMGEAQVLNVVDTWADQYCELARLPYIGCVTAFENRGAMMGASNPHPHGQIWAESSIPNELAKELAGVRAYHERHGRCLLCSYADLELERKERLVYSDGTFVGIVPFWAVWPFELLLIGRAHRGTLPELEGEERLSLARAMRDVTARYDRLFGAPFPYSMGFHQAPCDGEPHDGWHLHAHYYPPLLRSATVRKYMVGYEMLAQPQRDLTAEEAAQHLRDA